MAAHDSGLGVLEHPIIEDRKLWWYWRFYWAAFRGALDYLRPNYPFSPLYGAARVEQSGTDSLALSGTWSNLQRFDREDDEDYRQRLLRAAYDNWCALIVRAVVSHLLDDEPIRYNGAPVYPGLERYFADVDGLGSGNDAFLHDVAILAQVFGAAWVVTEKPAALAARTVADERAAGVEPRSSVFTPLDVPDWSVGDGGEFDYVVLRSDAWREARRPFGPTPGREERYRVWTRETWQDFVGPSLDDSRARGEKDITVRPHEATPEPVPHALGRVPVDVCFNLRDPGTREPIGISRLESAAHMNREHFNLTSHVRLQLYEQTFSWLAVPGGQRLMGKLILGIKRFLGFDPRAGGGVPQYIAPPDGPTRLLIDEIQRLESAMKAIAGMSRGYADLSLQPRPNDAANIESADKLAELRQVRANMQDWDRRRIETVLRWKGMSGAVDVQYGQPRQSGVSPPNQSSSQSSEPTNGATATA